MCIRDRHKREAGQTIGAGSIARKRKVIRNIIKKITGGSKDGK